MRSLALLVTVASAVARADDVSPCAAAGGYGEVGLFSFLAHGGPKAFGRLAGGLIVRDCARDIRYRLGATAMASDTALGASAGFGGEAEVDFALQPRLRLGGRASIEVTTTFGHPLLYTVGARLRWHDLVSFGLDGFEYHYVSYEQGVGTRQRSLGVMAGVGVEAQPGIKWSLVGGGVVVATVLVIIAGISASQSYHL